MLAVNEFRKPNTAVFDGKRIKQCFRTGWQAFKLYPVGFIAFNVIILLTIACQILLENKLGFIGSLLGLLVCPLPMGDYIVSAKLLQKQPCVFADFFSGFHYYQPLIIVGFILQLVHQLHYFFEGNSALLLVWTMIYIAINIFYLFTPLLIIDRRLDFWPAMERSRRMVHLQPNVFVFVFWGFLLTLAGILALGVGILVTMPVFSCAITAAYADLFGLRSKKY